MDKSKVVTKKGKTRFLTIKLDAIELPEFVESKSSNWVFAGKNNDYFNFLLDLYNTANIHNSIVTNKVKYVYGKGFVIVEKGNQKAGAKGTAVDDMGANHDGETLNDVLRKVSSDYEIYNGFCLEITYSSAFTEIAEIRHVDFSKVRMNSEESKYAYAENWLNAKGKPLPKALIEKPENGWTVYSQFDPETAKEDGGVQLFYYKEYRPSVDYYPLPDYVGCMQYIVAEKKIARYHVDNIDNNFWNNFIVHFRDGEPTEQEKSELVKMFKSRHNGTEAKEKVLFTFTDPGVEPPNVDQLGANNSAEVFDYLSDEVERQLFIGHQVTSPMLFGAKTEGQLGGREELIQANELYQNRYVNYRQDQLERAFNSIISINDSGSILKIKALNPITYDVFSSPDMLSVLTVNEKRRILNERYSIILDEISEKEIEELKNIPTPDVPDIQ